MLEADRCPLCDSRIYVQYMISEVPFGFCPCGALFNSKGVDQSIFNKEYIDVLKDRKFGGEHYEYFVRIYMPLVEEKTYGRDFLDVGFGVDNIINLLTDRGWNCDGIDLVNNGHITADFEHYDFAKQPKAHRYDFILMGNVLQSFKDPVKAIYKAYNLLNPDGILFISTPNTDTIRDNTIRNFGHFSIRENNCFINYDILNKIFGKCDESMNGRMEVLFADKNVTSKRFGIWNVMHVMAQKKKIEDIPHLGEAERILSDNQALVSQHA